MIKRATSVLVQLLQFHRTVRDAYRHRPLGVASSQEPLHDGLVSLESEQGRGLLAEAKVGASGEALRSALFAQSHPAFCALATAAVLVRAATDNPSVTELDILSRFSQSALPENWFHFWGFPLLDRLPERVRMGLTSLIKYDGMPLGAVAEILKANGLQTELYCGTQVSEAQLRDILEMAGSSEHTYVLLNVGRKALNQRGKGHFFLFGGSHEASDRALLLEVNSWRYPSAWARVSQLHASIQTTTPSGQPRGFLVVRDRESSFIRPYKHVEWGFTVEPERVSLPAYA
jgi:hypothetical protein